MPPMNNNQKFSNWRFDIKANEFDLFSTTVTNLLYENAYLEINRLIILIIVA